MTELLARYRTRAPRYTSYPTAPHFKALDQEILVQALNKVTGPLSLYVHLPFCEHLCLYCGCHVEIKKSRSIADPYITGLLDELDLWLQYTPSRTLDQLCLGGGTPTFLTLPQQERLIKGLLARLNPSARPDFSIEIDPRSVDDTYLEVLCTLGFNRFSFGVQDFDNEVLQLVARPTPEGQVERCIATLRRVRPGCDLNLDLMYGLPGQTEERFARSLEKTCALRPSRIALFHYAHVPWMKPAQKVLENRGLPDSNLKARLFDMATARLMAAGYAVIGMDHFALPGDELLVAQELGQLQRNFMGYTTRGGLDQLGIGVSAIGSFAGVYAQDYKDRESWMAALERSALPVERGLVLSDEDRCRRHVIMELFCNFYVQLPQGQSWEDEKQRMKPLEADGLVTVVGEEVRVTPLGRNFIRNICAIFDRYLEPEGTQRRYSMTA